MSPRRTNASFFVPEIPIFQHSITIYIAPADAAVGGLWNNSRDRSIGRLIIRLHTPEWCDFGPTKLSRTEQKWSATFVGAKRRSLRNKCIPESTGLMAVLMLLRTRSELR